MIDWLRRDRGPPQIVLAGRTVPVVLRRHARTRRMTLRLAPDGSEVRVTLPQWGRTADALDFVGLGVHGPRKTIDKVINGLKFLA